MMTDTEAQPVAIAAPPELAERALMIEMATQMALAAGYAPHCWPTWEQEATVIIPTIAAHRIAAERETVENIVAWLRVPRNGMGYVGRLLADKIEAGEHLK